MKPPEIPVDEAARLVLLHGYYVLDTAPEGEYDDLVRVAAHLLQMPIALVSLVDEHRQWFKARVGLDASETSREISFCGHVVHGREPLVVHDTWKDPRFADNPLVAEAPHIRAYVGAPLRTPSGHVLGTLCTIDRQPRAVTQEQLALLDALARQVVTLLEARRRAAEAEAMAEQLRSVSTLQRRFFELSLDMLCIAGYDGYFKQLNPAWTKTLGFSDEELKRHHFLDFVHPDDRESTAREVKNLAQGKRSVAFQNRYRTRDGGYRWLLWSSSPDQEHGMLMAVARDITPMKEAEQRLTEARLAAEAASRAKSELLANMSHELRTPLNSVIGFTNLLLANKHGTLGPRELDYLNRIATNGKHLLRLIDDLLDLAKIEAGKLELEPTRFDLGVLVRDLVRWIEGHAHTAGVRLVVTVPEPLLPLSADRHRFEQVVINLVGNAVKFATGGTVEVRIWASAAGHPLRLDVIDDGVGIPADEQHMVFEAFRQLDQSKSRRFGGTGLGLTISSSLCKISGFKLELASKVGRGSLFAVSFTNHDIPLVYVPPRAPEVEPGEPE